MACASLDASKLGRLSGLMTGSETVECVEHGKARKAFVCQHLVTGSGLGFLDSGVRPDNPFPDAWCSDCESVRVAEGGESGDWNDRSAAFAQVKLVCSHCYVRIRGQNRRSAG